MAPPEVNARWTPQAANDLESVHEFVHTRNQDAAGSLIDQILSDIDLLERFPLMGRKGRVENTRELVITRTPFIVVYRLMDGKIEILGILHGARKWPSRF